MIDGSCKKDGSYLNLCQRAIGKEIYQVSSFDHHNNSIEIYTIKWQTSLIITAG